MKKLVLVVTAFLFLTSAMAQAPEKMSYQAVIRNADNELISEQAVGMQISILQGSVSGPSVFVERQRPVTNGNGLVTIEIGTGDVINGSLGDIDWSAGAYFMKTETDPGGGTAYSLVATTQLLSVPYALHANTADRLSGGIAIEEQDPIFGTSLAAGITEADTAYWNNHTLDTDTKLTAEEIAQMGYVKGEHTTAADISEFGYVQGPHTDSTAIAEMGFVAGTGRTFSIGEFAKGGIVFWVDETGEHGLACAKTDQSAGIRWNAGTHGATRSLGDGPFAGELNTGIIISATVAIGDDGSTYAARICNELKITEGGTSYGDWYLPSKEELNLMYIQRSAINSTASANGGSDFASDFYWSSTELADDNAWAQQFNVGLQKGFKKQVPRNVRAIRAF